MLIHGGYGFLEFERMGADGGISDLGEISQTNDVEAECVRDKNTIPSKDEGVLG